MISSFAAAVRAVLQVEIEHSLEQLGPNSAVSGGDARRAPVGTSSEVQVRRVALLGGESSGKTTLAQAPAGALGTAWVPNMAASCGCNCSAR